MIDEPESTSNSELTKRLPDLFLVYLLYCGPSPQLTAFSNTATFVYYHCPSSPANMSVHLMNGSLKFTLLFAILVSINSRETRL